MEQFHLNKFKFGTLSSNSLLHPGPGYTEAIQTKSNFSWVSLVLNKKKMQKFLMTSLVITLILKVFHGIIFAEFATKF